MNPRFWALDLEFTQPLQHIIQIGVCIGNIHTGEIYYMGAEVVWSPDLPDKFITDLTGITPETVSKAKPIEAVWSRFAKHIEEFRAGPAPLVWGQGDLQALKKALPDAKLAYTSYNVKNLYQFLQIAKRNSPKAGLGKALQQEGLTFEGRAHDAGVDAYNTFKMAHHLIGKLCK